MNIAFPAFFILFLVLPGFLYIKRFDKKENISIENKGIDATSAQAVVAAMLLHFITLLLSNFLFSKSVDIKIIFKLLINDKLSVDDMYKITSNEPYIFGYFIFVFLLAYFSALIFQNIIFFFNPYKSSMLSFNLPWYYELKGKLEPPTNDTNQAVFFSHSCIFITCMINSGKDTYLYTGVLDDFYLNTDGSLDRIVLTEVFRRPLKNNSHKSQGVELGVDRMIIKYDEVINLTLDYLSFFRKKN